MFDVMAATTAVVHIGSQLKISKDHPATASIMRLEATSQAERS
jgi:hypothetical protein